MCLFPSQKCQFLSHQRGSFERLRLAGRAVAPTAKAQNFLFASCLKNFQTFFASYCLRTRSIDIVQNKCTNIDKSAVFYHAEPGLSRGLVKITGEVGKYAWWICSRSRYSVFRLVTQGLFLTMPGTLCRKHTLHHNAAKPQMLFPRKSAAKLLTACLIYGILKHGSCTRTSVRRNRKSRIYIK